MNETRLEYEFVDRDAYTMYPEKISIFSKNATGGWHLNGQVTYLNFASLFGQESIVSLNLPIGIGCRRKEDGNYPVHRPKFGDRFELEQEVLFNYAKKRTIKHLRTRTYTSTMQKKINIARTYSNRMYADLAESINVADTIDELTNASIRTYYDTKTQLLYSVSLDDDQCSTYNLKSNKSINWFYVQDSFVKHPQLYYMKNNYSYLGDYNVGDVPCSVFEKEFFFCRIEWDDWTHPNATRPRKTSRKNKNDLRTELLLSTHYFPTDANHWSTDSISVPLKIELRFFDEFYSQPTGNMTIHFRSFNPNPEKREKYDSSNCTEMDK